MMNEKKYRLLFSCFMECRCYSVFSPALRKQGKTKHEVITDERNL